jgi:Dyp-type peroxidase family
MLQNLQGNILSSHGRKFACHIFLRFQRDKQIQASMKEWIRSRIVEGYNGWQVTSAQKQLAEARAYRDLRVSGSLFVSCLFSESGYCYLFGKSATEKFSAEFIGGMKGASSQDRLQDPAPTTWEKNYRHEVDAMILLADSKEDNVYQQARKLVDEIRHLTAHIWVENGYVKHNEHGHSVEHFGYVDSRSQPLFFQKDVDREKMERGGIDQWNPGAGPHLVLTRDPLGEEWDYGSYLVFRKLQQDVDCFETQIKALANALGVDEEKARARIVGRFRDGTPLVLQDSPQVGHDPEHVVPNNFRYDKDFNGQRCPFHAHIRRMNPRWMPGGMNYDRRIARRGMRYGKRGSDPSVGLLFMCYQSNLKTQFEALQREWAQAPKDLPNTGYDPLVGHVDVASSQSWPYAGEAKEKRVPVGGFVTLQGGEYFFAPSINVLNKNL